MMLRRSLLLTACAATITPWSMSSNAQMSTAVAINRAARFRALSQRITKLQAQMLLGVMAGPARDTVASAQRLMQLGIEDLSKANLTGQAATQFTALTRSVAALNASMTSNVTKDSLVALNTQSNKLLDDANTLTTTLEESSKQASARIINLAGRQRMLSQRLAKNYFLAAAGLETALGRTQLGSDQNDFRQALTTLNTSPVSTPSIRNEIQLAQSQWVFFEAALIRKPDQEVMTTIATASERLLEVNNNLVVLYEAALKDLLGST